MNAIVNGQRIEISVKNLRRNKLRFFGDVLSHIAVLKSYREFKKTKTATSTGKSPNKRFNEQKSGCART